MGDGASEAITANVGRLVGGAFNCEREDVSLVVGTEGAGEAAPRWLRAELADGGCGRVAPRPAVALASPDGDDGCAVGCVTRRAMAAGCAGDFGDLGSCAVGCAVGCAVFACVNETCGWVAVRAADAGCAGAFGWGFGRDLGSFA
jgi:hypothetical protein